MKLQISNAVHTKQFHRLYQPYWLFFIVIASQLLTIVLAILPLVLKDPQTGDMIETITGVVRIGIFLFSTIYLIGAHRSILRIYFIMDNNILLVLSTIITYLAYNWSGQAVVFKYPALIIYTLVIIALTGNYRVMLIYCKWDRWQVISYKFVKLFGAVFFFLYGSYQTKNSNVQQPQLFLLYIFTAFAYYSQMYFGLNAMDLSDEFDPDYVIKKNVMIESKRLVTTRLIQMNSMLH